MKLKEKIQFEINTAIERCIFATAIVLNKIKDKWTDLFSR